VRRTITHRLGEQGFLGLYSLVALILLGWMIIAYAHASHTYYLWLPGPGLRHLPLLLMPLALIFIVAGVTARNPSTVGMENSIDRPNVVQGILRVTRHPVQWGILLWASAHMLANGDLASLLFFGGFLLVAGLGSFHIDQRMETALGERWRQFTAVTSHVPCAAILTGRQRLVLSELRYQIITGIVLFVLLLWLHPYLFGVSVY
jgi:uncharacterized membrane protein